MIGHCHKTLIDVEKNRVKSERQCFENVLTIQSLRPYSEGGRIKSEQTTAPSAGL